MDVLKTFLLVAQRQHNSELEIAFQVNEWQYKDFESKDKNFYLLKTLLYNSGSGFLVSTCPLRFSTNQDKLYTMILT